MRGLLQSRHGRAIGAGFTLIELLVVVAIIGLLVSILIPALSKSRDQVKLVNEMSAARQFAVGQAIYADAHKGAFFANWMTWGAPALPPRDANDKANGTQNGRYVYPFGTWWGQQYYRGVIFNGEGIKIISPNFSMNNYYGSLFPSFGLNDMHVGGRSDTGFMAGHDRVLDQILKPVLKARQPSHLIAFTSARYYCGDPNGTWGIPGIGGSDAPGCFYVQSPTYSTGWTNTTNLNEQDPNDYYGHVDFVRHKGRTVAGFTDGRVAVLTFQDAQDMRLWSNKARLLDDPAFNVDNY